MNDPAPAHPSTAPRLPQWIWGLGAALILGGLCLRLASGGLPVQTSYPYAASLLLDAGSRIADGQVPYRDFHTPIGFTYLGLCAFFLRLSHGLPHALALLSAGCGALVGAWTWCVAAPRCRGPLAALLTVLIGLLVASPAFYGYGALEISYGGHYSRLAWGILATVVVQAVLQTRTALPGWRALVEALGVGACLGLLFGIKFTFLFAGLVVLAASWWYRRPPLRLGAAMAVGALAAVGAGLSASGGSLLGYAHDCASLGGAVPLPVLLAQYKHKLDLLGLALVAALAVWTWPAHAAGWRRSWATPLPEAPLLAALVLGLGLVLSASTGIEDASPCFLLAMLVLAQGGGAGARALPELRGATLIAAAVLGAFAARLAMPIIKGPYAVASHQLTLAHGPWAGLDFMPAVPGTTDPAQLISYVWVQPFNLIDNLWYNYLAQADALLRPRLQPGDRVLSMDYINPLSYLLAHPAPRNDLLYWSFDRNVTPATAPQAALLFADADWVMVPKIELFHESSRPKQQLYAAWIQSHYRLAGENAYWYCYRRAVLASPAATEPGATSPR